MPDSPLVSCIVPAYNAERFLGESLDSILAQTYRPLEIVVVDDGSTDATPKIAGDYAEQHPGVVKTVSKENGGPASALNRGIREASGAFLSFLAADDLWEPDKLARQMDAFASTEALDVSVTHIQNFWGDEVAEEAERFKGHRIAQPMPGYLCVTMLAKTEVFERVGVFDDTLQHGNDIDWFLRARQKNVATALLPDVLVRRRMHETNRSRALASNSRDTILEILKASIDRGRSVDG